MPFGKMSFATHGIRDVCQRLSKPIHAMKLNSTVIGLKPVSTPAGRKSFLVTIEINSYADNKSTKIVEELIFDHVVFATQANQSSKILSHSSNFFQNQDAAWLSKAINVLDKFTYAKALVICHSDENIMPKDSSYWKCMNFAKYNPSPSSTHDSAPYNFYNPKSVAQCTHYHQASHSYRSSSDEVSTSKHSSQPLYPPILETTNPILTPDPSKTLSVTWFERAVVSWDSFLAVDDLTALQGGCEGLWFVGSYVCHGIPLLEGCVSSSMFVTQKIYEKENLCNQYIKLWSPLDCDSAKIKPRRMSGILNWLGLGFDTSSRIKND